MIDEPKTFRKNHPSESSERSSSASGNGRIEMARFAREQRFNCPVLQSKQLNQNIVFDFFTYFWIIL
jgi:hypothetical protein